MREGERTLGALSEVGRNTVSALRVEKANQEILAIRLFDWSLRIGPGLHGPTLFVWHVRNRSASLPLTRAARGLSFERVAAAIAADRDR